MKKIISKSLLAQSYNPSTGAGPLNYQDKSFSPPEDKPNYKNYEVDSTVSNNGIELHYYAPFMNNVKKILLSKNISNLDDFYDFNLGVEINVKENEFAGEKYAKDIKLTDFNSNKEIQLDQNEHELLLSIINDFFNS